MSTHPMIPGLREPVPARLLRRILNLWPPYLAAGIRVEQIATDYAYLHVSMRLRWYNRNYMGTHFGGSLYAMTDPFYALMLIQQLGPGHVVWDKAASVRFRRPGTGTVQACFQITPAELADLKARLEAGGRADFVKSVRVSDAAGKTVAEVEKVVYVRRR